MAFMPPVSAINGMIGPRRSASARLIRLAVSLEPVKATPLIRGSDRSCRPMRAPSPGSSARTAPGMPARCSRLTAWKAMSGVCSAGLAITALPAARAAATCPVKIASGKFQGLMQAKTPRPARLSWLRSPVGPGSVIGPANWARASSA